MGSLSAGIVAALIVLGLIGGVGITAIGPGGVLPTVGLFALTDLAPAQVAGTAIVTHIATGLLGSAAYLRSGELRDRQTLRRAGLLVGAAVVGAPAGVLLNRIAPAAVFGIVLAVLLFAVAVLLIVRDRRALPGTRSHPGARPRLRHVGAVGVGRRWSAWADRCSWFPSLSPSARRSWNPSRLLRSNRS